MAAVTKLVIAAIPMILGPALAFSVSASVVNGQLSCLKSQGLAHLVVGSRVSSSEVTDKGYSLMAGGPYDHIVTPLVPALLMLAGDVELNPGPMSQTTLMDGLAALGTKAPAGPVRNVVLTWSVDKNVRADLTKFKVEDLKPALAWLRNCTVDSTAVKGLKKQQLVEATLLAIERLLPDTCGECMEEYTVARDATPSLQCVGCLQGFHQDCLVALMGSDEVPKLPGKFMWLCSNCEPCYSLMTTMGPEGLSKPKSKRVVDSSPPVSQEPPVTQSTSSGGGQETEEVTDTPTSEIDCPLLVIGECPHGLSGKKDGGCKFRHRQRCPKYMSWGDKHSKGCKDLQCPKVHPELCVRSLALECFDRNLSYLNARKGRFIFKNLLT